MKAYSELPIKRTRSDYGDLLSLIFNLFFEFCLWILCLFYSQVSLNLSGAFPSEMGRKERRKGHLGFLLFPHSLSLSLSSQQTIGRGRNALATNWRRIPLKMDYKAIYEGGSLLAAAMLLDRVSEQGRCVPCHLQYKVRLEHQLCLE